MHQNFQPLDPKVILGVAAHPDDLDVGAGGTLAHFASQGAEIHYLILTDGGSGSDDPLMTSAELVTIRRKEQQAGLEIVGGTSITFLDNHDGELEASLNLKKEIVKVIRRIKPHTVITLDPTVIYSAQNGTINHPDHRAAGQATLDAVFPLARDRLSFPELFEQGYQPHKVATVLLINFSTSNFSVDITNTFDKKIQAIEAHTSQFANQSVSTWVKELALEQGKSADYELAESFVRIDVR